MNPGTEGGEHPALKIQLMEIAAFMPSAAAPGKASALVALGMVLLAAWGSANAASTVSVLDAGGKRASSASYVMDGSLGSFVGSAGANSPRVVARHGYAGQLYDVQSLALSASPTNVNETSTSQLAAQAILDDSTLLSLSATSVAWTVVSGLISSISANGLATTTNVYQDTGGAVRADYQSRFATLPLTIRNVGNDDFGTYARDGIDDAWQVRYFGLSNPNASPLADADRDGMDNYHEYIADTSPTNALSWFHIQTASNGGSFKVFFQSSTNRKYTLYGRTNLTSGVWTNIPSQTDIPGSGGVDSLTDPSSKGAQRYYRFGVRVP